MNQNLKFKDYVLADMDETVELNEDFMKNIDPSAEPDAADPGGYFLGAILNEVIVYLYAGEEEIAWKIFDKYYTLKDKEIVRELIVEKLKNDICFQEYE